MSGVSRSLIWKEWHEQRPWLLVLLAIAFAVLLAASALVSGMPDWMDALNLFVIVGPLASIFFGAYIAGSEQSEGTISFLTALPVSASRVAIMKLSMTLAAVWLPCVAFRLVAAVAESWLGASGITADITWQLLGYGCALSSLVIWMAAAGVNRRDEVQAGAVGLLGILSYWLVFALASQFDVFEGSFLSELVIAAGPGGVYSIFELKTHTLPPVLWPLVVAAVAMHAILIAVFVTRYGRIAPAARPIKEGSFADAKNEWLSSPRRWPLTAMLWKQSRESLPLAGLGAAAILIASICVWISVRRSAEGPDGEEIIHVTAVVWIMAGVLVSIVAGIGLFIDDLRPGLHDFWRSRPIRVDEWLAVKFVPGLLLTLVTLVVPAAVVTALVLLLAPPQGSERHDLTAEAAVLVAVLAGQGAAYCVAAAIMAVLRRPVFSALATIMLGVCAMIAMSVNDIEPDSGAPQMAEIFGVMAIVSVAAAWIAVRKDWGWKG